ncbi:MAG TPA: arylesterase [Opitutaceae bacterium]|jgi:acyl-CoA thioesterase-1
MAPLTDLSARILRALRLGIAASVAAFAAARAPAAAPRTIVFFGDSLTAGYGLEDPDQEAFPARIQQKLDAAKMDWKVVNAGVSGETSAGGLRRIDWVLGQPVDVLVLELGANDGLRGISPAVTEANLQAIILRVKAVHPRAAILIAGMLMPASMGQDFAQAYRAIFPALASKNNIILIPFLLEGVAGVGALNQGDSIHPTAAGDKIVADTVWRYLAPVLREK